MCPSPRTATYPELAERVFHSLPCGVLIIDRRGRITGVNSRTCDMFGVAERELNGRECGEVLKTEDPNWYSLDPIDRLGDPEAGRVVEGRLNGRKVRFAVELSPCLDDAGETVGTLVLLHEPFKRTDDPENQAERLISLGELSACVAHEIRNPLTGIRTTVQFVGRKLDPGDPRQEDLEAVISELDRIEKIIDDLLQFSRPQVGNKSMVSLNVLLDRTLDSLAPQCENLHVEVRRNLNPRLPESWMDPDMIQQVLFNLVNNALEAMSEGGTLKVTSTVRRFRAGTPKLEVFISDTGKGIDPDNMTRIFQPFFTTRAAGTGLGLPISLQIVRTHGGRISVRNRSRGGAIFKVSLPFTPGGEDA
jgi:two-component system sensor histidine kinase HydH